MRWIAEPVEGGSLYIIIIYTGTYLKRLTISLEYYIITLLLQAAVRRRRSH